MMNEIIFQVKYTLENKVSKSAFTHPLALKMY